LSVRCPDVASRFAWNDILTKSIEDYKAANVVADGHHNDILASMASTTRIFTNMMTGASNHRAKRNSTATADPNGGLNDGGSHSLESVPSGTAPLQTALGKIVSTNDTTSSPVRTGPSSPNNFNNGSTAGIIPLNKLDSSSSRISGRKIGINLATVMESPLDFSVAGRQGKEEEETDTW
jgi:hypothetical protein